MNKPNGRRRQSRKRTTRVDTEQPTREVAEETTFVTNLTSEVARRAREMEEFEKEQAELRRIGELADSVYGFLTAASTSAPGDPSRPITEDCPFASLEWAAQVVDAARAWREYHAIFGKNPRPLMSDDFGHEAGRLIFACACRTLDPGAVASLVDRILPPLIQIGKKVYIKQDRFFEGAYGIQDFFRMLAFEFSRSGGQLWKYDGRKLPGRVNVSARARTPHETHPSATGTADEEDSPPPLTAGNGAVDDATAIAQEAETRPTSVPADFVPRIMKALPSDGSWINAEPLLSQADYNPGGRYLESLAWMARPEGLLESHKKLGYRRRRPPR